MVARSLAKEPDERFQSAVDMAHALEQSLTTQEITILDRGRIESKTTFTTQPTEMMEQSSLSGKEQLPTVAMSEETRAEISGKPVKKQVSEMEADDLSHQKYRNTKHFSKRKGR